MNPLRRISLYMGAAIGLGYGCEKGAVTSPWRRLDNTQKRDVVQIYIVTCSP
jgi:hypothetical protein